MSTIRIAHSPDSDDHFMFWPVVEQRVGLRKLSFSFEQFDTESLNRLAIEGNYDVIAVSAAVYPSIAQHYLILPHGASVGRNYGPVLVSREPKQACELLNSVIGIPGTSTTAALVLKKIAPMARYVPYSIEPYSEVFDRLCRAEIDAALLIHEGQIAYPARGLYKVLDIGEWWFETTGLPLPLGINVIRRTLGPDLIATVSEILQESIRYAIAHKDEVLDSLIGINRERNVDVSSAADIERYLGMYANQDSLELDMHCRKALALLLLDGGVPIVYAP